MSGEEDVVAVEHIHCFHVFGTGDFKRPTRGCVFRVAGDPKRMNAMLSCNGNQQTNCICGITMTAMFREDFVADVTGKTRDGFTFIEAEIDVANMLDRDVEHAVVTRWNAADRMLKRVEIIERQHFAAKTVSVFTR